IVNDQHEPAAPGTVGRVRYRSNGTAEGFFGDPEASAEVFRDGWFYPGDLGMMNDEGYLFLKGRAKDVIIRGGVSIYPEKIEACLTTRPAVTEAAVVGWPARQFNEEVAAFVIVREPVSADTLAALCRDVLAPYKVPREIFFVDEFPRNSIGKVL